MASQNEAAQSLSEDEFRATIDHQSSEYLDDAAATALFTNGNPDDFPTVVRWFGKKLTNTHHNSPFGKFVGHDSPFARFSGLLSNALAEVVDPVEREEILKHSFRFVMGDMKTNYNFPRRYWDYRRQADVEYFEPENVQGGTRSWNTVIYEMNLSTYFVQLLRHFNGDISKAKALIKGIPLTATSYHLPSDFPAWLVALSAITSGKYEGRVTLDFAEQATKVEALAFWLSASIGRFNLEKKGIDNQLEDLFKAGQGPLKTEIMRFLSETIVKGGLPPPSKAKAQLLMKKFEPTYDALKFQLPDSAFVKLYEQADRVLKLEQMVEQTRSGKISPKHLVKLLAEYPQLTSLLTKGELEAAIDATSDHEIAGILQEILASLKKE